MPQHTLGEVLRGLVEGEPIPGRPNSPFPQGMRPGQGIPDAFFSPGSSLSALFRRLLMGRLGNRPLFELPQPMSPIRLDRVGAPLGNGVPGPLGGSRGIAEGEPIPGHSNVPFPGSGGRTRPIDLDRFGATSLVDPGAGPQTTVTGGIQSFGVGGNGRQPRRDITSRPRRRRRRKF